MGRTDESNADSDTDTAGQQLWFGVQLIDERATTSLPERV
jgi:hypothetical protein